MKFEDTLQPLHIDTEAFLAAMSQPPVVSFKLNRRKCPAPEPLGYAALEPVPWCRSGFYLPERPQFTLNPLLHAGAFYVQDASSMIYETIVQHLIAESSLPADALVLDACAAPGGKTTSIINALDDDAFVVANEFEAKRAPILRENLIKWGFPNILVTSADTQKFSPCREAFDLVVVDAPCSGEGMMRKEQIARSQWSEHLVRDCATLQREILDNLAPLVAPGGFMIYSTCTFNLQENEQNVRYMVESLGFEPVDLHLSKEWGILPQIDSPYPALRFMPHATRGEGLFAAVFRRPGENISPLTPHSSLLTPHSRKKVLDKIRSSVRVLADGIPHSTRKGKLEFPASESVLGLDYNPGSFPEAELPLPMALSYLRREAITLPADAPKGFVAVKYMGFPLGLVKNLGNRANNLYPAEWRIRNL